MTMYKHFTHLTIINTKTHLQTLKMYQNNLIKIDGLLIVYLVKLYHEQRRHNFSIFEKSFTDVVIILFITNSK